MLPTTVSFIILITAVLCTPYVVVNNNITLVIISGNIRVEITKPVWGMNIFNNATGKALIKECINGCQKSKPKLGFGWWEGTYFDLYQGYLWRLGEITEWHEATRVISVRYGKHDVWINVATTDPKNRTVTAHFYDLCDQKLSFEFLVEPGNGANRVAWGFDVIYKDRFLGFGERFNGVGQVGNVGSWTEDGSWSVGKIFPDARIPGGAASTYFPMPLFLRSSAGYGFQLNTFFRSEIDVRDSTVTMLVESRHFDATIFVGDNVRATFMLMTEQNGRSLIPPPWTFGPWNQLKSERAGVNSTTRAQQMLLEDDIPFSLNIDPVHFFPAGDDIGREDQLKQNNLNLLYMGIPSVAYFNAMVEDKWTTVYKEAAEKGYFTKNVSGDPYQFLYLGAKLFNVSQIDFTNLDAVSWYQKHLRRAVDVHYKGWMYDYGEYTPPDSLNSLNQSGLQSHNQYPLLYQKACFDFFTQNHSDSKYAPDYLFYVRSGYLGSARYTWAHWTGDPSSDWTPGSGIPAQLQAMLSIGISGIPFTGSDIGGFEWYLDEPPTLELWVRWTQLGAFSGLMQEEGSGKGIGRKTHIFDTPTGTRLWRKFAKLRMQLFPYIYTQAHIAHATGLPIMRHHVLDFYNDITAVGQDFQFMFGECFLVSPIVKEGETVHKVYLPKGENWIDVSTNLTYDEEDGRFRIHASDIINGSQFVKMHAPLDSIPLLVKSGSIIPLLDPHVQTLSPTPHPNITGLRDVVTLQLWAWPDWTNYANGYDWQGNCFYIRPIQYQNKTDGVLLKLQLESTNFKTTVVQMAVNNKRRPIKVNVVGGVTYSHVTSWQDVAKYNKTGVWFFDEDNHVLWLHAEFKNDTIQTMFE